jgi:hypothetical protein
VPTKLLVYLHCVSTFLFLFFPASFNSGHGFKFWKQPLAEMQGKSAYIRPKVVGRELHAPGCPFLKNSGPFVSIFLNNLYLKFS